MAVSIVVSTAVENDGKVEPMANCGEETEGAKER